MKKIVSTLLCMALLIVQAMPAFAEEMTKDPTKTDIPELSHTHSYDRFRSDSATCAQAGVAIYACICGEETQISSQPTGNHTYNGYQYVDSSSHKQVCSVCGNENTSAHRWDAGRNLSEANCTQEGEQVFTCMDCGGTYSQKIPKTGHNYDSAVSDNVYHVCGVCNSKQSHSWDAGEVTRRPTCKENGILEYNCSVCEMTRVEVLPKLTIHTYDSDCDSDCNVCGSTREIEHTFSVEWSKNEKGHWHTCTKCGQQKDYAKHNTDPNVTEEEDQVCLTCKYIVAPKKDHVHSYESIWSSDEVGHWYECSGCQHEKDYAAHKFDDACDPKCNVCSYEREDVHSYGDEWQSSKFEHWQICTACGEESAREKHIPGPEATPETAQMCMTCAYEIAPRQEHTHDFSSEWEKTEEGHWQVCSCGEKSVPEPHVWMEEAEHKSGKAEYFCTECGMRRQSDTDGGASPMIPVLIVLMLVCAGGIAALVFIMRRKENQEFLTEQEVDEEESSVTDEEDKINHV